MPSNEVIVKDRTLEQDLYYKNTKVMHYSIKYPHFISNTYHTLANKLNNYYRTKAVMYQRTNIMQLYQEAMVDYEYSIANDFPVHEYEAVVEYTVTYNENCMLSLYFDQYEYTGGAHGNTVRTSDTWNLTQSKRAELSDFFPGKSNYNEFIIGSIINQIKQQVKDNTTMVFDDYPKLVAESFKTNNFYLSEDGVVIYFQQYDIAPYASGILTFVIPFGRGGATEPQCP